MIAKRVARLLQKDVELPCDVGLIYTMAGVFPPKTGIPFRAPHHTVSVVGMLGNDRRPAGEVHLAHRGVLYLDNFGEFRIETIRKDLRAICEGHTTTQFGTNIPCNPVKVILSTRLCSCGKFPLKDCSCSEEKRKHYWKRLQKFFLTSGFTMQDFTLVGA